MTPEDVSAIRERLSLGYTRDEDVLALRDALEAEWFRLALLDAAYRGQLARAEKAEAERDKVVALLRADPSGYPAALAKLEADLREEARNHLDDIRLLQKAERLLATAEAELRQFKAFEFADMQATKVRLSESLGRVEALCDEWQGDDVPAWTWRLLRAAIEGPRTTKRTTSLNGMVQLDDAAIEGDSQ